MTTQHPPLLHVLEDLNIAEATNDSLADFRGRISTEVTQLTEYRGRIDQELWTRAKEARPEVETTGTAELVGEQASIKVGADRTWEWDEAGFLALQGMCVCGHVRPIHGATGSGDHSFLLACTLQGCDCLYYKPLLTLEEYSKLVTWVAKVDGREYNSLQRRGGIWARVLAPLRTLKSARPTVEVTNR